MVDALDDDEMARWQAWKAATDTVWEQVVRAIGADTGLSAADFSVLTRVVESGDPPRQQQLADSIGWQRSRLSRQLSRMADRGLLERVDHENGRVVRATPAGRRAAASARTAHARAVRAALLDRAPHPPASPFWRTVDALGRPT